MNGDAQAALFEFRTAIASRLETNPPRQIAPVGGRARDKSRLTNSHVDSKQEIQTGPKGVDAELQPL